jgi:phosphatidate cytidylyltransferase
MQRLLTAAILVPLLYGAIKWAAAPVFYGAAVLVIVGACWECYRMMQHCGATPFIAPGLAATAATVWSHSGLVPGLVPSLPIVALIVFAVPAAMALRPSPERILRTVVETVSPVLFIGATMGYLVALRAVPDPVGEDLVLLLFVCVVLGDTLAYYVGKRLGRHRLAPQISPNKTWEGFLGAMVGATAGALIAHLWFYQRLPLTHVLPLGLLLGVTGVLGDLAESVVKRACQVKDSSGLLPGHGGIFDRTDNLLFASPVLYYYYVLWLGTGR